MQDEHSIVQELPVAEQVLIWHEEKVTFSGSQCSAYLSSFHFMSALRVEAS